jgi:hypothetical protein
MWAEGTLDVGDELQALAAQNHQDPYWRKRRGWMGSGQAVAHKGMQVSVLSDLDVKVPAAFAAVGIAPQSPKETGHWMMHCAGQRVVTNDLTLAASR